jgi:hypothetical protein
MIKLHRHLLLATALATGLAVAVPLATAPIRAEESATVPTNPGFKPDSGQINLGAEHPVPSSSDDIRKIPTPAEARAALMMPVSTQPSTGAAPPGGPQVRGTNAGLPGGAQISSEQKPAATSGAAVSEKTGSEPAASISSSPTATAAVGVPPSGPIGSVGETIPAKFSKRNDILDRVPIMAWPNRLTDQDRQKIYQAVMADKSQPAADADALAPTSELSADQALNGMHVLPESVRSIDGLNGLQYVKGKNKVLLVTPATRTVVDEISS